MLPIQTLQRHEKAIYAIALWHDTLYSGSEDMEIKVRNVYLVSICVNHIFINSFTSISDFNFINNFMTLLYFLTVRNFY